MQISGARFLYVDTRLSVAVAEGATEQERAEAATRRAQQKFFLSLHNAMDDVAALVSVKQRESLPPRLGLLVSMEDEEAADGSQVRPTTPRLRRYGSISMRSLQPAAPAAVAAATAAPAAAVAATAAPAAVVAAVCGCPRAAVAFHTHPPA